MSDAALPFEDDPGPRRLPDQGWRIQPYVLDEGTYEFELDAAEGDRFAGYVFRLRVAGGPLDGHRILVKESAPIAGVREAIASGRPCRIRGTIKNIQGRGKRFVRASLI